MHYASKVVCYTPGIVRVDTRHGNRSCNRIHVFCHHSSFVPNLELVLQNITRQRRTEGSKLIVIVKREEELVCRSRLLFSERYCYDSEVQKGS